MSPGNLRAVLVVILVTFLAAFVQGSLFRYFLPAWPSPNFVVILAIYLGFRQPTVFGSFLAFGSGLLFDLCSALLIGPWAGALVIVFCAAAMVSSRIFADSLLAVMFAVFAGSIAANLVYLALVAQFARSVPGDLGTVLGEALFTALFAVPVFRFIDMLFSVGVRKLAPSSPRARTRPVANR